MKKVFINSQNHFIISLSYQMEEDVDKVSINTNSKRVMEFITEYIDF